jgi:mannose-6-phosphate isomerase
MAAPEHTYPLKLRASAREKVWGGRSLEALFDRRLPGKGPIGEVWTAWAGLSVSNGAARGVTLQDLVNLDPIGVLGGGVSAPTPFPLLVKFLDARAPLSIQVHPDDRFAQDVEKQSFGKSEMWHVVQADPGATVLHGTNHSLLPAELRAALDEARLPEVLATVEVKAGDIFINPPGTIHALGRGVVLFELQQSSDITYRLYDWDRQTDGRPARELHLDKGLAVSDLVPPAHHTVTPVLMADGPWRRSVLGASKYYACELLAATSSVGSEAWRLASRGRFEILTALEGEATIRPTSVRFDPVELSPGQSLLIPALLGDVQVIARQRPCRLYRSYVPDLRADLVDPLRRLGFSDETIVQLGGDPARSDLRLCL